MGSQSNPHHFVFGKLKDFLTGDILPDTLDERYRQKIAKTLVINCCFEKKTIKNNMSLEIGAGVKKAIIKIDFLIDFQGKTVGLIKFAPGSLVTRRLSTLALSRIIRPYQIPLIVVTNGEDAEIVDGDSGKVISTGYENLPDQTFIEKNMKSFSFNPINEIMFDKASRIAYACEVDGACSCDSDICVIQ